MSGESELNSEAVRHNHAMMVSNDNMGAYVQASQEFFRWHAEELRKARAEAWDEGYAIAVMDTRTADALQVDVGLGSGLYAQPARVNPYRADQNEVNNNG